MSNFLRDLAIAKFPRFGIVYYIQCNGEPTITGNSMNAPLKFWDGKTTPPTHILDKSVKLPIWKWGEMLDVIEEECFSESPHIIAVELVKRRPDDSYGELQVRLDHQVTLDAQPELPTPSGPPNPASGIVPQHAVPDSEGGQPAPGEENHSSDIASASDSSPGTPCLHENFLISMVKDVPDKEDGFYCNGCGERVD